MTQDTPPPTAADPERRRIHTSTVVMGLMVLGFLAVVWQRNEIRARWWARQLAAAQSEEEAWPYAARLCVLGETSIGPLSGLFNHSDPAVRRRAVETAGTLAGARAARLIVECALHDGDVNNRRAAILLLSERDEADALATLRAIVESGCELAGASTAGAEGDADARRQRLTTNCTAVHALALTGTPGSAELLLGLLEQTKVAASSEDIAVLRVEIILALGDLLAEEAVGPLVAWLADESVFEGVTERDRHAAGILGEALMGGARDLPPGATMSLGSRHVVGACAEEALYRLTGRPRDSAPPGDATRQEVQESWRQWLAGQAAPKEPG